MRRKWVPRALGTAVLATAAMLGFALFWITRPRQVLAAKDEVLRYVDPAILARLPDNTDRASVWSALEKEAESLDPSVTVQLAAPFVVHSGDWLKFSAGERSYVSRNLRRYSAATAAIRQAALLGPAAYRRFEAPPIVPRTKIRMALELLNVETGYRCSTGSRDSCAQALTSALRIYDLCERSPTYASVLDESRSRFPGFAQVLQQALKQHQFTSDHLASLNSFIPDQSPVDESYIRALKAEFTELALPFCTDHKTFEKQKWIWGNGLNEFQFRGANWNSIENARAFDLVAREAIKNVGSPSHSFTQVERLRSKTGAVALQLSGVQPYDRVKHEGKLYLSDNSMGLMALHLVFYRAELWPRQSFEFRTTRAALKLVLGLLEYEARHGELPETPAGLTKKKVLSSTPMDPWSGKPFFYSKAGRKIWSVGENLTDDGGSPYDNYWFVPTQ